ncbi:MarR family winged helix-turn-helix transcriptional regulator [Thermodesulfobacteriota bacterium]
MSNPTEPDIPIEKTLSRNLKRAYNIMHGGTYKVFKNIEITAAQYDLMETILLSQKKALSIQELTSNTVSYQPNITRMVVGLENDGFVERSSGDDRRIVMVRVTSKGKKLVAEIQKSLLELHLSQYKDLSRKELYLLNDMLIKVSRI